MRTQEEIREYLMLNDRFPEIEETLIQNALFIEKMFSEEIESGKYEYAVTTDYNNSPFILEDEDEVNTLIKIKTVGGLTVYQPIFIEDDMEIWKNTITVYSKNLEGKFEFEEGTVTLFGDTKEEVEEEQKVTNAIYTILELSRINQKEYSVECLIEKNEEWNDTDTFYIQPQITYTNLPSKLVNWDKCPKNLPIIYSIDKEKSFLY